MNMTEKTCRHCDEKLKTPFAKRRGAHRRCALDPAEESKGREVEK